MSDLHFRNLPVPFLSQRKNAYEFQGDYTNGKKWAENISLKEAEAKGLEQVVYNNDGFLQYNASGTLKVSMASRSCNITCLAMLLHYFGITKDSPDEMMKEEL